MFMSIKSPTFGWGVVSCYFFLGNAGERCPITLAAWFPWLDRELDGPRERWPQFLSGWLSFTKLRKHDATNKRSEKFCLALALELEFSVHLLKSRSFCKGVADFVPLHRRVGISRIHWHSGKQHSIAIASWFPWVDRERHGPWEWWAQLLPGWSWSWVVGQYVKKASGWI